MQVAAFLAASVAPGEQQWKKLQACIPDLVGLPHRMELVHKDVHGVRWVDDSVSTSVKSVQVREAWWRLYTTDSWIFVQYCTRVSYKAES